MRQGTVCFPIKNNQVLLFLIEYPDGARKWNGIGGYVEEGESLEEGLSREFQEEIGLDIDKEKLKKGLTLDLKNEEGGDLKLTVFVLKDFEDTPNVIDPTIKESKWFNFDEIPYEKMHAGNKKWLPGLLR